MGGHLFTAQLYATKDACAKISKTFVNIPFPWFYTFCAEGVKPRETDIFYPPTPVGSKGATRVWNLGDGSIRQCEETKITAPILRLAPKTCLTTKVNLRRRDQQTPRLEHQQKTRKKFKFFSATRSTITSCFSLSSQRRWLSFHILFRSPADNLKRRIAINFCLED